MVKRKRRQKTITAVDVADMECLSTETASKVYDVPESTLRTYARDGKIPGVQRIGKKWIFTKEGLASFFKGISAPVVSEKATK